MIRNMSDEKGVSGLGSAFLLLRDLSLLMLGTGVEEFSRQTGKLSYPIHKVQ